MGLEPIRDPKPLFAAGKPEGLNGDEHLFIFVICDLEIGTLNLRLNTISNAQPGSCPSLNKLIFHAVPGEFCIFMQCHFLHNPAAVSTYGLMGNIKLLADFK